MPELAAMGTILHYGAAGDGPGAPVVALHGSASTGAQWRTLAGYLGGRHRVFTPDLAGYGRSGLPRRHATLADEVAFLAPLVAGLGEPVHLVGHSYGGAVALEIARTMPESVRSLTVIEPAAFHLLTASSGDAALAAEIAGLAAAVRHRAASGAREAAISSFIDYWNGSGAWSRTSVELRAFLARCLDRVVANFATLDFAGAAADLAAIACPVLAVMGLESRLPAMRATERVAEIVPGARLALVPGGHMAPLTDPHAIDPLVAAHIAAAPRPIARPSPLPTAA